MKFGKNEKPKKSIILGRSCYEKEICLSPSHAGSDSGCCDDKQYFTAAVLNLTTVSSSQSGYQINTSGNHDFTTAPVINASLVPATTSGTQYKENSTATTPQIAILAGPASSSVTVASGDFAERLNFTSIASPSTGKVNFTVFDSYTTSTGATLSGEFTVTVDITASSVPLTVYIYVDFGTTPPLEVNDLSVIVQGA